MRDLLAETMAHNECQTNRSCAKIASVVAVIGLLFDIFCFTVVWPEYAPFWMWYYIVTVVIPVLLVAAYARWRNYKGREIKYLIVASAATVPIASAIPSIFGFYLMALPLAVVGRYYSRKLLWGTYVLMVIAMFAVAVPHALISVPYVGLETVNRELEQSFLDGNIDRFQYWKNISTNLLPILAFLQIFFTLTMHNVCRGERLSLEYQASLLGRLADVEKGLAIAAAQTLTLRGLTQGEGAGDAAGISFPTKTQRNQPVVRGWSSQAISECIAACKKRAAVDAEFAKLIETDPAAAVNEVIRGGGELSWD